MMDGHMRGKQRSNVLLLLAMALFSFGRVVGLKLGSRDGLESSMPAWA